MITAIPSLRRPRLVYDYAERLANELKMLFEPVLLRTANAPEQKSMANSPMQAHNVQGTLAISGKVSGGPVYPFTLARASARKT